MKSQKKIDIELKLGWSEQQINSARTMLSNEHYAKKNKHKIEYSVFTNAFIRNLCFDYFV